MNKLPLRVHLLAWTSAVLSGFVLASGFPPSDHGILAWVALVPLLHSLIYPGATSTVRFGLGWVTGVTFTTLVLLRPDAVSENFRELIQKDLGSALSLWLSMSLQCSVAALPLAIFGLLAGVLLRLPCLLTSVLLTTCLWTGLEYATGLVAPSLSWTTLVHAMGPDNPLAQNVDLLGIHGLSFFMVLCNIAVYAFFARPRSPVRWIPLLIVLTATGVLFQRGGAILYDDPDELATEEEGDAALAVTVLRFDPDDPDDGVRLTATSLRSSTGDHRPRLVVWPATAATDAKVSQKALVDALKAASASRPLYLIHSGASDAGTVPRLLTIATGDTGHNSQVVHRGDLVTLAGGLAPVQIGILEEGDLRTPSPAGALALTGATLLVATLNEEKSSNPALRTLNVVATAYRAIENRKWVVRSSAHGVSTCINPHGEIESILGSGVHGDLKQAVHLYEGPTPFALGGFLFAPICLLASVIAIVVIHLRNRPQQPH